MRLFGGSVDFAAEIPLVDLLRVRPASYRGHFAKDFPICPPPSSPGVLRPSTQSSETGRTSAEA